MHFKQHHPMQWKRVLLYCTLQFLHCDWFLLLLLTAGCFGVMDKWLDTHARGRGFKHRSYSYFFSSFKGKVYWFYWLWRQLRALKTAAFQTTSPCAMEKSASLHFTISSLWLVSSTPIISWPLWCNDKWLNTNARDRGFEPSSCSYLFPEKFVFVHYVWLLLLQ